MKFAAVSLAYNMVCSALHIILGAVESSWWLFVVGTYYAILSIVRFAVLRTVNRQRLVVRFAGAMLMLLSLPLAGMVVLAFVKDRGTQFHLIVMLAMAVYAFVKITLAAVKWARVHKEKSAKLLALRNISFATAFVSIYSLQRSMLVSFEGMTAAEIRIMNAATGSAVCIIVFLLGMKLLKSKDGIFTACQDKK